MNTGIARLVVRDFPLTDIHPSALPAAIAAQCAADQGQFWAMYDQLFATFRTEWGGVPNRDRQVFSEFAAGLGLDQATFDACLADPAREAQVLAEQEAAFQLGINSTPNFLVNGQLLRGALPFRAFSDLIAQETGP